MFLALAVFLIQPLEIHPTLAAPADRAETAAVEAKPAVAPEPSREASSRLNLADAEPFLDRASFRSRSDLAKLFGVPDENPAAPAAFLPGQVELQFASSGGASASGIDLRDTAVAAPASAFEVKSKSGEPQRTKRLWYALVVAQHSAAAFDAWSTRRVVESGQGRELNPFLRPFAGSNALYAATQVGPSLLDYLGKRMMTSERRWVRKMWWVPQVAGTATSLASGAHNLRVAR